MVRFELKSLINTLRLGWIHSDTAVQSLAHSPYQADLAHFTGMEDALHDLSHVSQYKMTNSPHYPPSQGPLLPSHTTLHQKCSLFPSYCLFYYNPFSPSLSLSARSGPMQTYSTTMQLHIFPGSVKSVLQSVIS